MPHWASRDFSIPYKLAFLVHDPIDGPRPGGWRFKFIPVAPRTAMSHGKSLPHAVLEPACKVLYLEDSDADRENCTDGRRKCP